LETHESAGVARGPDPGKRRGDISTIAELAVLSGVAFNKCDDSDQFVQGLQPLAVRDAPQ
jgi:hypothetical protein